MNVLSLFSGIGGLDLGLERAGMTVAGQVEIDPWCRSILAKHWPEVPRHDDVRTAAGWWAGRDAPDLVAGGFPCQPVSVAGKGLAQADSRWLWPAFAGTVRDLRPRFVLVENVPGLLAHGMGDVLGDLAALGYDAEWDCVPAAFVGAPHIRNRVFIVAYTAGQRQHGRRGDGHGPEAVRLETVAAAGNSASHVADADSPGLAEQRESEPASPPLATIERSSNVADAEGQRGELRTAARERPGRPASSGSDVADPSSGRHGPSPRVLRPGRHGPLDGRRWPAEPDVGRVAHGIPRRVDRLRGLGNAVVPQVAEHIGRLIMAAAS